MPVKPEELKWQAERVAEQVEYTAPQGVGFAVLFWNKNRDSAVAFACNAKTEDEKREAVKILREFANSLNPSRIVVPS